jgi:hypothetical protein
MSDCNLMASSNECCSRMVLKTSRRRNYNATSVRMRHDSCHQSHAHVDEVALLTFFASSTPTHGEIVLAACRHVDGNDESYG